MAYKLCDKKVTCCCFKPFFEGCNKAMCMGHCETDIKTKKHGKHGPTIPYLAGYHCKTPECEKKYQNAKKKMCCFIFLPIFLIIVIFAIVGNTAGGRSYSYYSYYYSGYSGYSSYYCTINETYNSRGSGRCYSST